jgi:hypothetical protein
LRQGRLLIVRTVRGRLMNRRADADNDPTMVRYAAAAPD